MEPMVDEDGVEWVSLGNGDCYCPELKDGMVWMLADGQLIIMSVETFEALQDTLQGDDD